MRKIFIILLLGFSLFSDAQINAPRYINLNGYYVTHIKNDSANWSTGSSWLPTSKAVYDFVQGRFNSYTPSGGAWGTITGTLFDQVDLRDSLLSRLLMSDTLAMLAPLWTQIEARVRALDTAAMLNAYRHWEAGYLTGLNNGNGTTYGSGAVNIGGTLTGNVSHIGTGGYRYVWQDTALGSGYVWDIDGKTNDVNGGILRLLSRGRVNTVASYFPMFTMTAPAMIDNDIMVVKMGRSTAGNNGINWLYQYHSTNALQRFALTTNNGLYLWSTYFTGQWRLHQYGVGTFGISPAYILGVTSDGYVGEVSASGLGADGYVDGGSFDIATNKLTITQTGAADVNIHIPSTEFKQPLGTNDTLLHVVNDTTIKIKSVTVSAANSKIVVTPTRTDSTLHFSVGINETDLDLTDSAAVYRDSIDALHAQVTALQTQLSGISSYTTIASSATPAPVGSALFNQYWITALATNATISAPSGPVAGNHLLIAIQASTVDRTLTWNVAYEGGDDIPLPTTALAGKWMYISFTRNGSSSTWQLTGLTENIYTP